MDYILTLWFTKNYVFFFLLMTDAGIDQKLFYSGQSNSDYKSHGISHTIYSNEIMHDVAMEYSIHSEFRAFLKSLFVLIFFILKLHQAVLRNQHLRNHMFYQESNLGWPLECQVLSPFLSLVLSLFSLS